MFSMVDNFSNQCVHVVPENLHTPLKEGIGNSWGRRNLKDQKMTRNV